ncbi:tRNA (5-methylaminomethyl-2-thiouridine)(34)-methyltransferase MnmD [Roseibium sp.]|nr:tRNA (5-methylaminomethyl-2-thiouridine)(34)-methyltransferase MnmD [Roseibium sp. MMSF_3544]
MPTKAPELEWLDSDVPRAEGFGDTYFSKAGGLAETRHVFLNGNGLPQRFLGRETFTIAEFGFGTGLNFLTTLAALAELEETPRLTFLSFELFPLTVNQLTRALGAFPDLADLADELTAVWVPEPGWNKMTVSGAELCLGVGDAREMIADVALEGHGQEPGAIAIAPIDAWYLDGFSPAKNPELWDADLLKWAADLTAADGTLATYTAAGWVRRNLQSAGFSVEKKQGFAGKREMVVGRRG